MNINIRLQFVCGCEEILAPAQDHDVPALNPADKALIGSFVGKQPPMSSTPDLFESLKFA